MSADASKAEQAGRRWDELLESSSEAQAVLSELLIGDFEAGFLIPGLAKFVVLRPLFMTGDEMLLFRRHSEAIVNAHRKVLEAVLSDSKLKDRHFGSFLEWTERVLELDRPGPVHGTCLRLDGSFSGGRPEFIELNADMPQGIGLCDSFSRFLSDMPFFEEFRSEFAAKPVLVQDAFLDALLTEWKASGRTDRPRIGFITWDEEPVRRHDMELNRDHFASRRFEAVVADPRELEFDGNSLTFQGEGIDLAYRVISTAETLERADDMKTLVEAEKNGAVLMVNSFRSELSGNKMMFALLQDGSFDGVLSREELRSVNECIPWTKVVSDDFCTDDSGSRVELVPWVLEHRDDMVLKPAHDFGGHGVVLGSQCTDGKWESALESALEEDYIVQKRIELGRDSYPVAADDGAQRELYEDIDPFILSGRFSGCLTRLSEDLLTNVHLHGALGAVFEIP